MLLSLRARLAALVPAALLLGGSVAFLGAGSYHPHIGAAMGRVGSDDFFRAFGAEILRHRHWETMHAFILAGPVLWTLGLAAACRLLPARAAALGEIARAAAALAASLWCVAFVLDGYIAPQFAAALASATDPASTRALLADFRLSQLTMARIGMVSLALIGATMSAYGCALVTAARGERWGNAVGALGCVLGVAILIESARGEFSPAPFTSPLWSLTALSIGLWFAALAAVTARQEWDAFLHPTPPPAADA